MHKTLHNISKGLPPLPIPAGAHVLSLSLYLSSFPVPNLLSLFSYLISIPFSSSHPCALFLPPPQNGPISSYMVCWSAGNNRISVTFWARNMGNMSSGKYVVVCCKTKSCKWSESGRILDCFRERKGGRRSLPTQAPRPSSKSASRQNSSTRSPHDILVCRSLKLIIDGSVCERRGARVGTTARRRQSPTALKL